MKRHGIMGRIRYDFLSLIFSHSFAHLRGKMAEDKKKRTLLSRLKSRFRLVVMNEETFEEKASFRLRPLNVFVAFGLGAILLVILTSFIIAFTGLREYIPGYADLKTQRRVLYLVQKTDSMEMELSSRDQYIENIRKVIDGNFTKQNIEIPASGASNNYDTIHKLHKSQEDSLLRQEIESQDQFSNGSFGNYFRFVIVDLRLFVATITQLKKCFQMSLPIVNTIKESKIIIPAICARSRNLSLSLRRVITSMVRNNT